MSDDASDIAGQFKRHYGTTFATFGATARGVDWGREEDVVIRYQKMLSMSGLARGNVTTLLDVGCGYGGLLDFALSEGHCISYTGIDVVESMILYGAARHRAARFIVGDVLEYAFSSKFDYVVCNGVLTQKLVASNKEMDRYANDIIRRLFDLCNVGIAFNIMTDQVNFRADNLYYRSPAEVLNFCREHLSRRVLLDHSYPLYEYTVFVYKNMSAH